MIALISILLAVPIVVILLEVLGVEVWPRNPDGWERIVLRSFPDQTRSSDLIFTRRVEKHDAERLAEFLKRMGYFDSPHPVEVVLSRRQDAYVVSFPLRNSAYYEKKTWEEFEQMRLSLVREVFDNQPVIVELCNPIVSVYPGRIELDVRKTLP